MDSHHVDMRVTQNGKTRNFITRVVEVLERTPVIVTITATGRCINKLVTVVEMAKSLISKELHQYTIMMSAPSLPDEHDQSQPPPFKSQLVVILSSDLLPDQEYNGYQHHNPALKGEVGVSTHTVENKGEERDTKWKNKGKRRGIRRLKKKELEDAKNVIL